MSATGGTLDVAGKAAGGRKLIAVVYADMVDYSRLIGLDDAGTLRRLRTLRRALIDPAIREHGGRVVQTGGDSLLVAFDSIDGAVRCAVKVQQHVPIYDGDQPADRRIRFRIGINIGDVIPHGTDLHGDGVNIAARLEAECPVGGICVSRTVRDHVHGRLDLPFEAIGPLTLKNIARPVEAFVVRFDPGDPPHAPVAGRPKVLKLAGLAVLLLALSSGSWWLPRVWSPPVVEPPNASTQSASAFVPPPVGLSSAPRLSLVVLPFDNLSGSGLADHVVDGITDDLTTDLSRVPGLVVIARNSAFTYKGKPIDIKRVGEDLGVRYALEGSVRKIGDSMRVNAQLVSTETGVHLWADRFDVQVKGSGIGQDEIVPRLAAALGIELVQVEATRSARERSTNPDASDLILQARALQNQPANVQRDEAAKALYERALQLDPSSAWAMARLAATLMNLRLIRGYWQDGSEKERVEKLLTDAHAIAPAAEITLGTGAYLREVEGHYQEAMAAAQRLIDVNPNNPAGYIFLARNKIYTGQAGQAIPLLTKAMQLSPRDPYLYDRYWRMGYALLMVGRYDELVVWQERSLAAFPDAPAGFRASRDCMMAVAYAFSGQIDNARRAIAEAKRIYPFWTIRYFSPEDLTSEVRVAQVKRYQEGLRMAGARDHADEDADFGVSPDGELRANLDGYTARTVPGARTIRTIELMHMLAERKLTILDFGGYSWGRSIPGAIALPDAGVGGSFSDWTQDRLRMKMRELTKEDLSSPVVAVGWNSEDFSGQNIALRLVALGYTEVYWYRGGREAWEVAGMPEAELTPQDW